MENRETNQERIFNWIRESIESGEFTELLNVETRRTTTISMPATVKERLQRLKTMFEASLDTTLKWGEFFNLWYHFTTSNDFEQVLKKIQTQEVAYQVYQAVKDPRFTRKLIEETMKDLFSLVGNSIRSEFVSRIIDKNRDENVDHDHKLTKQMYIRDHYYNENEREMMREILKEMKENGKISEDVYYRSIEMLDACDQYQQLIYFATQARTEALKHVMDDVSGVDPESGGLVDVRDLSSDEGEE